MDKSRFSSMPELPSYDRDSCTLSPGVNIVGIVKRLERVLSYDEVHVSVITQERAISQGTTVQRGISSLMGLIIATSGCPHAAFFRPMARFHLPFATVEETVYRATSTYLLAQYFLRKRGQDVDFEFEGLNKIYHDIQVVNTTIAKRLRTASETDSAVNALVLLDMFAKTLPQAVEKSLEEIRHLFTPFLTRSSSPKETFVQK